MDARIITESWFWKGLDGRKEDLVSLFKEDFTGGITKECFFEVPEKGIKFVYLPYFKRIITLKEWEEEIKNEDTIEISLEDWTLTKVSSSPDPGYILNYYKKHESYWERYGFEYNLLESGSWVLKNNRTGEEIEFSSRKDEDSWRKEAFLCFPEKCINPVNIKEVNKKEYFIKYLINGIRKANSGSDIEG